MTLVCILLSEPLATLHQTTLRVLDLICGNRSHNASDSLHTVIITCNHEGMIGLIIIIPTLVYSLLICCEHLTCPPALEHNTGQL
ncbi:hypothetical protein JB92DRAFT_848018 [Gautieria morchelliformis]|nr:hypothetical protein JB92DRAFT_848018 [Gautieria morchelliformis]